MAATAETTTPQYLDEPSSVCKDSLDGRLWCPTFTVEVGSFHIGIRASDTDLDGLLRRAMAPMVVADGKASANFSLLLADAPDHTRAAGFHLLYRNSNIQVRSRDPLRMVEGLATHLSAVRVDRLDGLLALQMSAFLGPAGAILGPEQLSAERPSIERRLGLRGISFVDVPWVFVDVDTAELVVPEPAFALDPESEAELRSMAGGRPDPPIRSGRYPIRHWLFTSGTDAPLTRGQALAVALRAAFSGGVFDLQETLDRVKMLLEAVEVSSVPWGSPAELADAVGQAAS